MPRGRRLAAVVAALAAAVGVIFLLAAAPAVAAPSSTPVHILNGPSGSCTAVYCYQPSTVDITGGDAVGWSNDTSATHTVTRCTVSACAGQDGGSGADGSFGSSTIDPGQSYKHSFSTSSPGTYFYYCTIHGYSVMHGEVVVSGPTPTPQPPTFSVGPPGATPVPTPTATPSPTPSPSPSATPSPSGSAEALVTPTASPSPSSDAGTGTVGDTGSGGGGFPLAPVVLVVLLLLAAGGAVLSYRLFRSSR